MLRVEHLNAWYDRAQILHDVSLRVESGEFVALLGRNGAGKSTTLRSIMGLLSHTTGQVHFRETSLTRLLPYAIARLGLAYTPEDRRVFPELSVTENLSVGRQPPRADAPVWSLARIYELFPHLASLQGRPAGQLSGGEQQMLAIARTLMGNPALVLLDEPSEGLAPKVVQQLAASLERLKAEGLTVLLSEQNYHFTRRLCDRAYIIEKGCIRYGDTMAALVEDDDARQAYLTA